MLIGHICMCGECKTGSTESNPTGHGKETVFRLINVNRKKTDKYVVDKCLLKNFADVEKCDFLFKITEDKIVYLVECKGSDVLKAMSQISSTLDILKDSVDGNIVKGRIVTTKVYAPNIRDKSSIKLRERLKGDLIIKNKIIEEKI